MVKFKNKDEAVDAYKKGQIDFGPLCKILKDLGEELPNTTEIHEWDEERESHLESRREANQLPVVLALALMVAVLSGAIVWVISSVIFGKSDDASLQVAREAGIGFFALFLILALVLVTERRVSP